MLRNTKIIHHRHINIFQDLHNLKTPTLRGCTKRYGPFLCFKMKNLENLERFKILELHSKQINYIPRDFTKCAEYPWICTFFQRAFKIPLYLRRLYLCKGVTPPGPPITEGVCSCHQNTLWRLYLGIHLLFVMDFVTWPHTFSTSINK